MSSWCRKGGQRAIDELQRTISEIEAKYKAELGRQRKKFETDIREYEIQVETLNRANAEMGKNSKAASSRIKVLHTFLISVYARQDSRCDTRPFRLILTQFHIYVFTLTSLPYRKTTAWISTLSSVNIILHHLSSYF